MSVMVAQRCLNHPSREAAARCPECAGFFCRECITEHDDRVICSACLARLSVLPEKKRGSRGRLLIPFYLLMGIVCAWLFFYCIGRVLVSTPSSFHEGTVWKRDMLGSGDD
ncbi:MAG: rhomboid family protein [Chthoniobacteraceae bacterium]|nr:rhomboid family protein [Chthoniobacteraceae bacterium]MDB6170844.1 rhomboid family protein [Chthoniobacteraceae bacterium]